MCIDSFASMQPLTLLEIVVIFSTNDMDKLPLSPVDTVIIRCTIHIETAICWNSQKNLTSVYATEHFINV